MPRRKNDASLRSGNRSEDSWAPQLYHLDSVSPKRLPQRFVEYCPRHERDPWCLPWLTKLSKPLCRYSEILSQCRLALLANTTQRQPCQELKEARPLEPTETAVFFCARTAGSEQAQLGQMSQTRIWAQLTRPSREQATCRLQGRLMKRDPMSLHSLQHLTLILNLSMI